MKNKKEFKPKIKADEQVIFDESEPEKFSNFEMLEKRVELLQEIIDQHAQILEENRLKIKKEEVAKSFDSDELFKRLDENE